MGAVATISNTALPPDRDFQYLKEKGVEYIKEMCGHKWTDFNDSDPGVTILDQLVYVLTELGYCTNFPIQDVLTQQDGKIDYESQFFYPQEILTCSPITGDDYRKLVVDAVRELWNVFIEPLKFRSRSTGGIQSFLYIDPGAKNLTDKDRALIAQRVFVVLNDHRNVGEFFAPPVVLTPMIVRLTGQITLNGSSTPQDVLRRMKSALQNHFAPRIQQYGYNDLIHKCIEPDGVFNGPELQCGWIPDSELLAPKQDLVHLIDVLNVVSAIDEIRTVDDLKLDVSAESTNGIADQNGAIPIPQHKIAEFVVNATSINVRHSGSRISPAVQSMERHLAAVKDRNARASVGASVDIAPPSAQGKFRDIAEYYSVQNTFPPQYAVGSNSSSSDCDDYRLAQARQLKAYLLVFDQLLANQFCQLAHIPSLFSFRTCMEKADNVSCGNPPSIRFSPTYFSQPLYDVPDVKRLLVGNDSFNFCIESAGSVVDEHKAWKRFKADPLNEYIVGLRQRTESDDERDDRRNRMLNHLLARHGENTDELDQLISGTRGFGSELKTQIIVKSVYLQNYRRFSYDRVKSCNYLRAAALGTPGRYRLTQNDFEAAQKAGGSVNLPGLRHFVEKGYGSLDELRHVLIDALKASLYLDDILAIYDVIKLTDGNRESSVIGLDGVEQTRVTDRSGVSASFDIDRTEFRDYSTYELKVNLMLGLDHHYSTLVDVLARLVEYQDFEFWLSNSGTGVWFETGSDIRVVRTETYDCVCVRRAPVIRIFPQGEADCTKQDYQDHIDQLNWLKNQRRGFVFLENALLALSGVKKRADSPSDQPKICGLDISSFYLYAVSAFPAYLARTAPPSVEAKRKRMQYSIPTDVPLTTFEANLAKLRDASIPAHVAHKVVYLSHADMGQVIDAFIDLHEYLRDTKLRSLLPVESVGVLVDKLVNSQTGTS